ncbi:MAG: polymerase III subunit beta protein [Parcubacteria group bacterium GW2011_GWA2_36_10]|nr:MAG: polymerase III subunit beta protein [Parcubacteria group bacterium GW2011_GWA2_36_10]
MKLTCTQENLNKGLSLVSHIANKNNNLPILNNVLLKADKNGLLLVTTDLEIGIKAFVRGKVDEEGEFTVGAKLLNDFVSLVPKENIDLELKENTLKIKSKNQKTNIKGLEAEDFPLIPEIEKENEVELNMNDFKTALSQLVFSASLDSSRLEINAVFFNFLKNELVLAATDSYRLAEKKLVINSGQEKELIVPLKTIQELLRILNDQNNQALKIYFNENQIMFVFDGVELISRVVSGKYPDYQQIIPKSFNTEAKFAVNQLVPAIKSAALFCKPGINDVRLSIANNQIFPLGHHMFYQSVIIGKSKVAIRDQTQQMFRLVCHQQTGYTAFHGEILRFLRRYILIYAIRLFNHIILRSFHSFDFFHIFLNRHKPVDNANSAQPRHRDRHIRFGHRIHI